MDSSYVIEDAATGRVLADGAAVLVAYDYHTQQSIPIPDEWRQAITRFEGLPQSEPS
jgi:acyl-CoA thioesterase FadM